MTVIKHERAQWQSSLQYLMTCICYAVGLGNIWRFPSLAYEHGGSAFLMPYLLCSFIIGFPILYLEMSLGQFSKSGPAVAFGRIRPAFQGVGWGMAAISIMVAVYYNVICAWIQIYLYVILTGHWDDWSSCMHTFNTIYCQSSLEDEKCTKQLQNIKAFFFNGSCHFGNEMDEIRHTFFKTGLTATTSTEEFFENYVLQKSGSMEDFQSINWKLFISLGIAWLITALVLLRGVEIMGRIAWFTGSIPYVIIVILFFRCITLDGSEIGMRYLMEPDFSHVFRLETWRAASTHVCYTLAIGFGGLLSLSSFNAHNHNCYRDAFIITMADGINSLLSGTAVFAVLGFMSKQLNKPIDEVIESGTGLIFIAYPEAISRMPMPWLWSFLFFFMLFLLGVASQFGMAEVLITAIYDQFPATRPYKAQTSLAVCSVLFMAGIIMTTRAGIFYFNIFDSYSASFPLILLVILELILIIYIYGLPNYLLDIQSMMGEAKTFKGKIFGSSGLYIQLIWKYLAPITTILICVVIFVTQVGSSLTYGKGKRLYIYPSWAIGLGWFISMVPVFFLPIFIVYNIWKFKQQGKGIDELFKLQPKWTSYNRVMNNNEDPSSQPNASNTTIMSTEINNNSL